MIRAILFDIGYIVDNIQKNYSYCKIPRQLYTKITQRLSNAIVNGVIVNFTVDVSQELQSINLHIRVLEDTRKWESLRYTIDKQKTLQFTSTADYDRAMKGI